MTWELKDIDQVRVSNVDEATNEWVRRLLRVHRARHAANYRRTLYTDSEQPFKDLGIAMPPQLKRADYVLGWSAQAVKKPAMRSQFDGLRMPGDDDPFDLGAVLDANRFSLEFSQAVHSAYKHGMSLLTVGAGGPGEAPVQIIGHSAETSAAVWDQRTRRLAAALTIAEVDPADAERPTELVVYLPGRVVICTRSGSAWVGEVVTTPFEQIMAVPVVNDPQLGAPLGRSRLTRSVMRLNDIAVRTMARMEGNAEFYSSPQVALLGVDYETFYGDNPVPKSEKVQLAMDRLMALSKDEDGDTPTLTQLTQATMTPHSDMMRTVAMAFAGETGLPPSSLGVVHDQPASAEAIRAAEHDLLIDVTRQNTQVLPWAVKEVAALAVMIRDGLSAPPEDMWRLSAAFADPEFRSLSAHADAVQKLAADMPSLAKYPVLLERIFSESEVERIQADSRRAEAGSLIAQIAARPAQASPAVQSVMNEGVANGDGATVVGARAAGVDDPAAGGGAR